MSAAVPDHRTAIRTDRPCRFWPLCRHELDGGPCVTLVADPPSAHTCPVCLMPHPCTCDRTDDEGGGEP